MTLTASVVSGTTPVTEGQALFCNAGAAHCEDSAIFGSAWITKTGTATIHKIFGLGSHNIQAVFQGTASFAASPSAAQPLTVTSALLPTTTTLIATGTTGSYALSATVTASSTVAPTGSVSFLDASNGNAVLASGVLGTPVLTPGFANTPPPPTTESTQVAVGDFNKRWLPRYRRS